MEISGVQKIENNHVLVQYCIRVHTVLVQYCVRVHTVLVQYCVREHTVHTLDRTVEL